MAWMEKPWNFHRTMWGDIGFKAGGRTTKIFLNMTSKNGSQKLISLLQYMKNTDINNPDITVRDERLPEPDKIMAKFIQSEEGEAELPPGLSLTDINHYRVCTSLKGTTYNENHPQSQKLLSHRRKLCHHPHSQLLHGKDIGPFYYCQSIRKTDKWKSVR